MKRFFIQPLTNAENTIAYFWSGIDVCFNADKSRAETLELYMQYFRFYYDFSNKYNKWTY